MEFRLQFDISEALAALDRVSAAQIAPVVGVAVAEEARDILARYPAASGRAQPFRSAKSRRFFFAALRDGRISVPYRRGGPGSQGLGRRWLVTPDGLGATLANSASYAGLVQGERAEQARYHRGTWPGVEEVAAQMERDGTARQVAEEAIVGIITQGGAG
jgi:hypothetical protein